MKIEYDSTIDEAVDTNLRAMARSEAIRSIRSRSIWTTTIASGVALYATWVIRSMMTSPGPLSIVGLSIALLVSLAITVGIYMACRWFYDWTVSRRVRRLVEEQFAKSDSTRCAIETRPGELWVSQHGTEIGSRWTDLEELVDTGDAIELHFRNALIVARNRVFKSAEERAEFIRIASEKR